MGWSKARAFQSSRPRARARSRPRERERSLLEPAVARVCELDLDKKRGCIWRLSPELRGCATAACLSLWTFSVDLATPAPLDPFSDNVPSSSLERRLCCGNKQRAQQLAASLGGVKHTRSYGREAPH